MRWLGVILALCLPLSAYAAITSADEQFIAQFNRQLETLGQEAGVMIRYEDVGVVDEPITGRYYSFHHPSVTLAHQGVQYIISTRTLSLHPIDGGYRLSLPATFYLGDKIDQPPQLVLALNGVPELLLKSDQSGKITHYRVNAPEAVTIETKLYEQGQNTIYMKERGSLPFDGATLRQDQWATLEGALKPEAVQTLLTAILQAEKTK